jgi:hypothetical protein
MRVISSSALSKYSKSGFRRDGSIELISVVRDSFRTVMKSSSLAVRGVILVKWLLEPDGE